MKLTLAIAKGILFAAAAIVIAQMSACAPKAVPVSPIVQQVRPERVSSASPTLDDARRVSGDADQQAAVSADRIARANAGATSAQAKARAALAEAERLRAQKTATERELANQSTLVAELNTILDAMGNDLAEASASLAREKTLRNDVSMLLVKAQDHARAKDQEADTLRSQLNHAEVLANSYYQTAEHNAKAAQAAAESAASAAGRVSTWRNIAIAMLVLLLLSLAAHIVRSYLRL